MLGGAARGDDSSETPLLPIDSVKAGMRGTGRTVFDGQRVDTFDVEILGVLAGSGPQQHMIVARLEGGPLAKTGVIAGMSGSPVFIDGRLVGAVAYGFPFGKEPIAGITPIGEMIAATARETPRPASARLGSAWVGSMPRSIDSASFVSLLKRSLTQLGAPLSSSSGLAGPSSAGFRGEMPSPLTVPLLFRGFDPSTLAVARDIFAAHPLVPTAAGGAQEKASTPPLEAGGAVSISLMEGDLDISATGTVTTIRGGRVYAFGHPFYNLGPTRFPMKQAFIHAIFPSLQESWKMASTTRTVGTFDQDRNTGIAGDLGPAPRMIPVGIDLTTSRGEQRTFSVRVADDELLTPALTYLSLLTTLQTNERTFGTSSMAVRVEYTFSGGKTLQLDDIYAQGDPAASSAALVAAPLAFVLSNPFQPVGVESIHVAVGASETAQSATLERAWVEPEDHPMRPGDTLRLRFVLRTHRGEPTTQQVEVPIPPSTPAGPYVLAVMDAPTMTRFEAQELRGNIAPRNLDQVYRALDTLRRNSHLYVHLLARRPGVVAAGDFMPSLPPSVLSVLQADSQANDVLPIRAASYAQVEMVTAFAVSGARYVPVVLER